MFDNKNQNLQNFYSQKSKEASPKSFNIEQKIKK